MYLKIDKQCSYIVAFTGKSSSDKKSQLFESIRYVLLSKSHTNLMKYNKTLVHNATSIFQKL